MSRHFSLIALLVGAVFLTALGHSVKAVYRVALVPPDQQTAIRGGGNKWCQQTNMTCPDAKIPADCTLDPNTQTCKQCVMSVPNWSSCKFLDDANYSCVEETPASNPFCGTIWVDPPLNGSCEGRCTTKGLSCGSQIPNTTGLPCP